MFENIKIFTLSEHKGRTVDDAGPSKKVYVLFVFIPCTRNNIFVFVCWVLRILAFRRIVGHGKRFCARDTEHSVFDKKRETGGTDDNSNNVLELAGKSGGG